MTRNLFAYTELSPPAGGYPGYVSVNVVTDGIEFTVRSTWQSDPGVMVLTPDQARLLARKLLEEVGEG